MGMIYAPGWHHQTEADDLREAADHIDALTEEVERLKRALSFGVKLYGMDGPAYWPVEERILFDELARGALKGKDQ